MRFTIIIIVKNVIVTITMTPGLVMGHYMQLASNHIDFPGQGSFKDVQGGELPHTRQWMDSMSSQS